MDKAPGWIAFCNQKLYVRSTDVNGAVAVISPETLDVERITTLLGGGQPEKGSIYDLAPAVSRETKENKIPMFSDGKMLYFARFEKIQRRSAFSASASSSSSSSSSSKWNSYEQDDDDIVEYG
jgi:hypothetical protein